MKIKPCPFCGRDLSSELLISRVRFVDGAFFVECPRCRAQGPSNVAEEDAAIVLWNKRAPKRRKR